MTTSFVDPDMVFIEVTVHDVHGMPPPSIGDAPCRPFAVLSCAGTEYSTSILPSEGKPDAVLFAVPRDTLAGAITVAVKDRRPYLPVPLIVFAEGTIPIVDIVANRFAHDKTHLSLTSTLAATMRNVLEEGKKKGIMNFFQHKTEEEKKEETSHSINLVMSAKVVDVPQKLAMWGTVIAKASVTIQKVVLPTPKSNFQSQIYIVIRYGNAWRRLSLKGTGSGGEWIESCEFEVRDLSSMVCVVVVQKRSSIIHAGHDKIIGRVMCRLSTLTPSTDYSAPYPLCVAKEGGTTKFETGEIYMNLRVDRVANTMVVLKHYLTPPIGLHKHASFAEQVRRSALEEGCAKSMALHENVIAACLEEDPHPPFDVQILLGNKARVSDAGAKVIHVAKVLLADVKSWERPWASAIANATWVYICFRPDLIIPIVFVSLAMVVAFHAVRNKFLCTPQIPFPEIPGAVAEEDEDHATAETEETQNPIKQMEAKLDAIKGAVHGIQDGLGVVAGNLERFEALLTAQDRYPCGMFFAACLSVACVFFYIPQQWLFSLVGLVVLRHPLILPTDDTPPPPYHALMRLPTRLDRYMVQRK